MKNFNPTDKQDFKKFLKLYNRYIYSIVNQNNLDNYELPDEIITDEELEFLFNIYQEAVCIKRTRIQ